VQRLRTKAYDRKKLATTKEQKVTVRQDQNRQFIYIEPSAPDSIYVPYYEPQVVFGDWPYSDYPAYPYDWGYPGYIGAGLIATGVAFGAAYALGRWASGGYWGGGGWWGGSQVNWGGGAIDINRGARVEHWQHDARHRQGARYNNSNLQQRFGNANQRPGGNRPGVGAGANRPNVGDRGQRTERRANRQAGAGRTAGNRQARNRSAAGRHARSGGRVAHEEGRGGLMSGTRRLAAAERGSREEDIERQHSEAAEDSAAAVEAFAAVAADSAAVAVEDFVAAVAVVGAGAGQTSTSSTTWCCLAISTTVLDTIALHTTAATRPMSV
jgi:hypothetical protein